MLGFLLLGLMSEALFSRLRVVSIWTVLLAYFLLRFSFGGDAFDAFHVLGLALVVLGGWAIGVVMSALLRSPGAPTASAPGGGDQVIRGSECGDTEDVARNRSAPGPSDQAD